MKNKFLVIAGLSVVTLSTSSFAKSKTFALDADHSSVDFKISHLIGKVKGSFKPTEGKVEYDADKLEKLKVSGVIDAASIDTNVAKRDEHLKSPDFFDVNNASKPEFKTIKFESTKFTDVKTTGDETTGKLEGNITIHGVTKPQTLDITMHKAILDPWGNDRIAISATGKLNRKDFGLTWNKAVETGGFVVGDEVDLALEVEAFAKPDASKKDDKKVMKKDDKKEDKNVNPVQNKL